MIDFASGIGAPVVTIGTFRGRAEWAEENGADKLADMLRGAGEYAEPRGVCLALEPINHFSTNIISSTAEDLQLLEHVSNPSVGLLRDTCRMNMTRGPGPGPCETLWRHVSSGTCAWRTTTAWCPAAAS